MALKRPVREAVHSAPHIVYVKNTWIYAATPPLDLMVYSSIVHKNIYAYTVAWLNDVLVMQTVES
jgi:hypothetical protein